MAGKDHHHIWRMLQRGFGERKGKDHHIWVYRKGAEPKPRGTGNFGVEKYFYGVEGSETDLVITEFENSVQSSIQDARERPNCYQIDPLLAAKLATHLQGRSNFLRSELSDLTGIILVSIADHFSSPEKVRKLIKVYLRTNPEGLKSFFAKALIPINDREQAMETLLGYIENLPDDALIENFRGPLNGLRNTLSAVPALIKEAHNNAILQIRDGSPMVEFFSKFDYKIFRPEGSHLILPDTCIAFIGVNDVAPFIKSKTDLRDIIIPISSEAAIIGSKGQNLDLRAKTVNKLLAGCAYEAFGAKLNDQRIKALSSRIGKYAKLLGVNELNNIVSFEQLLRRQKQP